MANLQDETVNLTDPTAAVQAVDDATDLEQKPVEPAPVLEEPVPTLQEPESEPEVEAVEELPTPPSMLATEAEQKREARRRARTGGPRPIIETQTGERRTTTLPDSEDVGEVFSSFRDRQTIEREEIDRAGPGSNRTMFATNAAKMLAFDFDANDANPQGGDIAYDYFYLHNDPEIDAAQREIINGTSDLKPLGYLTNTSANGGFIEGSTADDGSLNETKLALVDQVVLKKGEETLNIPFSEVNFDIKLKKMSRNGAVAIAYESDFEDKEAFPYDIDGDGKNDVYVRVFPLNNNAKHAALVQRNLRGNLTQNQQNILLQLSGADSPEEHITRVLDGQVAYKDFFDPQFIDEGTAVRLDGILLRAGLNVNDRIQFLRAHHAGIRETLTGPRQSIVNFFTTTVPNMAIGILNNIEPGNFAINPYVMDAENIGRNQEILQNSEVLPHVLLAGKEYLDLLASGASQEQLQEIAPEGLEVGPDGRLSIEYFPSIARKFAELTGITVEAAEEVLAFSGGFTETLLREAPEVGAIAITLRTGAVKIADGEYTKNFLPFVLKELGLKNEREYQEFLSGGPKNLQKAFAARQAFFAQRSGLQEELTDFVGQAPDTTGRVLARIYGPIMNSPRRFANFWRKRNPFTGENAIQRRVEMGSQRTELGRETIEENFNNTMDALEEKATKHYTSAIAAKNAGKVGEATRETSSYVATTVRASASRLMYQNGIRTPYDQQFLKEEGKALFAYAAAQTFLNETLFPEQTQHGFLAEVGFTLGAYALTDPLIGVGTGLSKFFTGILTGESVTDASRHINIKGRQARDLVDNFLGSLSKEEREQYQSEIRLVQSFYSDILSLQEKYGVNVFPEDMDLPMTLGQFFANSEMMAAAQALRAERHVADLKDLPSLLRAEETLAAQQKTFGQNLLKVADAALQFEDDLSPRTKDILRAMRDYANETLEVSDIQIGRSRKELRAFEETVIDLLEGGVHDGVLENEMSLSNLTEVIDLLQDELNLKMIDVDLSASDTRELAARIERLARAKNKAINTFIATAKNPANGIGMESISEAVGVRVRDAYENELQRRNANYAEVERLAHSVDPTTGEKTVTVFADLYGTFKGISERGILNPESALKDSLIKNVTRLNRNIPQERQVLVVADSAANRHFTRAYGDEFTPTQHIKGMHEKMPADIQQRFPLPMVGKQEDKLSNRSIDAWEWKDELYLNITQKELDELYRINPSFFGEYFQNIKDVELLRYTEGSIERSIMDLPFTPTEYWELKKAFNRSANSGTNLENRRLAAIERDRLSNETKFYKGYGTENPEIDTTFQDALDKANKDARKNFYLRFDSNAPIARSVIFGGKDAEALDKILAPIRRIKGNSDDFDNARIMEQNVVDELARIFGGVYDSRTNTFVLVEGEGTDLLKEIFVSFANQAYLKSDAGEFLTTAAEAKKVGLGLKIDLDGVKNMNLVSSKNSKRVAMKRNEYAKQTRAMANIKVYKTTVNEAGETDILYDEPPTNLFEIDELIDFSSIDKIVQIDTYREPLIKFQKTFTRDVETAIGTGLEKQIVDENDILVSIQSSANRSLRGGLETDMPGNLVKYLKGTDGPEAILASKKTFVQRKMAEGMSEEVAEKTFDTTLRDLLAKDIFGQIKVQGNLGEYELDLVKMYDLLNDPDNVRLLDQFGGDIKESLQILYNMGSRLLSTDPQKYVIAGKPLTVNVESFINKAWQVSRNTVSPRFLFLEAIFRTSRRTSFEYLVAALTDPKVANAFAKISIDGYVAEPAQFDMMYEVFYTYSINHYGKEILYAENPELVHSRPGFNNFASKRNFKNILVNPKDLSSFTGKEFDKFEEYQRKQGAIQ